MSTIRTAARAPVSDYRATYAFVDELRHQRQFASVHVSAAARWSNLAETGQAVNDFTAHFMDRRIYAPTAGLSTWKHGLEDPDTQWVRTKSAFEIAAFWECGAMEPRGLHPHLIALLEQEQSFEGCDLIASFPGHRVRLPDVAVESQMDVWAVVRTYFGLVSLAVEGKAGEGFAETVGEWRTGALTEKNERIAFLCDQLGLTKPPSDEIRYQLLHRTVSALLEAERVDAAFAAMVIVSFTDDPRSKDDFGAFTSCLGGAVSPGQIRRMPSVRNRPLFLGWLDAKLCTDAEIAAIAV